MYGRYDAQFSFAAAGPDDPHDGRDHCGGHLSQVYVYISAGGYEPFSAQLVVNSEKVTANYSLKRTVADGLR
jgi:hypothetical protein